MPRSLTHPGRPGRGRDVLTLYAEIDPQVLAEIDAAIRQHATPPLRHAWPAWFHPDHARKLDASSLDPATVARCGMYTEADPAALRRLLGGSPFAAPALVFPHFDRGGRPTGYATARNFAPGLPKYVCPAGRPTEVYVPPLEVVWDALDAPEGPIVLTEGVLKAIAAARAGVPCLGLAGVWNFQKQRADRTRDRELIPSLEAVDWRGRRVLIVYDYDPTRKPDVNHAAAELARLLTARGADVRVPRLPPGKVTPDGPGKLGVDDFVAWHGPEAFARWVGRRAKDPPTRTLADWRAEMEARRAAGRPGRVYLDRSPPGAGKSTADRVLLTTGPRRV